MTALLEVATVSVVLADGQAAHRARLRGTLGRAGGISVVGEASTVNNIVIETLQHRPDVLITDLRIGAASSVDAIRRVTRSAPGTAVLVLTGLDDDLSVLAAMRAGARGYLIKDGDGIAAAVRGLAAGEAIFGSRVARQAVALLSGSSGHDPLSPLTERERAVLGLIAAGLPNSAIAERMRVRPKTIRNQVSIILCKLRVSGRAEAIGRAWDAGLGVPPAG